MSLEAASAPAELPPPHRPPLAPKLLVAIVGLCLPLLLAEVGLRIAYAWYLNPFVPDETIGYRLKPDFDGYYPWTPVHTDSLGRRVPERGRPPAPARIVFVGDSVTFGFGEPAADSYPFLFAERLRRRGEVVDLAVPGYNLMQALARVREVLATEKPEVVFYGLCLNDLYGGASPTPYALIDPHFARMQRHGFLSSSALVAFVSRRMQAARARLAPPPPRQRTHENLLSKIDPKRVGDFERQLGELQEITRSAGVPLLVLVFPFREQIEKHPDWRAPQEYLAKLCTERGLRCLDARPMLEPHRQETLYSGASNMHFSAHGNRLIADWLAAQLPELARIQ